MKHSIALALSLAILSASAAHTHATAPKKCPPVSYIKNLIQKKTASDVSKKDSFVRFSRFRNEESRYKVRLKLRNVFGTNQHNVVNKQSWLIIGVSLSKPDNPSYPGIREKQFDTLFSKYGKPRSDKNVSQIPDDLMNSWIREGLRNIKVRPKVKTSSIVGGKLYSCKYADTSNLAKDVNATLWFELDPKQGSDPKWSQANWRKCMNECERRRGVWDCDNECWNVKD